MSIRAIFESARTENVIISRTRPIVKPKFPVIMKAILGVILLLANKCNQIAHSAERTDHHALSLSWPHSESRSDI